MAVTLVALGRSRGVRAADLAHVGVLLGQDFGLLGVLLASAFGYGSLAVLAVGLRERADAAFFLFAVAIGLGVLAHLTLGLGAMGLLYPAGAWGLFGLGMTLAAVEVLRKRACYRAVLRRMVGAVSTIRRVRPFSAALGLMLFVDWLYPLLANALVPPTAWDAVAYHLAAPAIYIRSHTITYIPYIPYTNWPFEAEMLFTLGLLVSSEALAQLTTWAALLLTCGVLYLIGRRHFGHDVGLLAAVVFAGTPMVGTLAGTGLIELPLTMYSCLAVYAFVDWLATERRASWALSALSAGLAASTKLNGAVVPALLGLLSLVVLLRRPSIRWTEAFGTFLLYGLLAFAVVAPWYLKSWILTQNPIWPFLSGLLGGRDWDSLGTEYLLGFIRSPNMPATPLNWLLAPWYILTEPARFAPYRVRIDWVYLTVLPLGLLAALRLEVGPRRAFRLLTLLAIALYTVWFLETHQIRFLMTALPVFALLVAIGLRCLWTLWPGVWTVCIQGTLILYLASVSWLATPSDRAQILGNWPFLSGRTDRQQYLLARIPEYATYAYANEHTPDNARILLGLYECRGYYLERDYFWANPIGQRALRFEQVPGSDALASELWARGFTHVIFDTDRADRYDHIRYGKDVVDLFRSMLATHGRLLYRSSFLELYELLP